MLYTEMARAHAQFMVESITPPRVDEDGIKTGPCGNYPRSLNPVVFTPGQEITVEWKETIDHPGSYRIAFSPSNDQGFDDNVLAEIVDTQDGADVPHYYSANINLPDMVCEDCSLQLIQTMTDRNPPTQYFSCADIRLVADSAPLDVQNVTISSGNNEISLSWQLPAVENIQVMVLKSTVQINDAPVNGAAYDAGDNIGEASVLFVGNASQVIASGLEANQNYHFKIFTLDSEYRYSTGVEVQQTVSQDINDTQAPASVQNFSATVVGDTIELAWVNPVEDFYKVLILWDTNPIESDPIDTSRYNIDDMIGSTSHVVFNGLGNMATVLDLPGGQTYYFKIYAHDASFNYSRGVDANAFLPATGTNQKPQLTLVATQNGGLATTIYQDRGLVRVTVMIEDDSDVAQATINWEGTDDRLVDIQDSFGAGSVGHLGLLLFLLLLQRYYSMSTRRKF